jgi:hypothetical protein
MTAEQNEAGAEVIHLVLDTSIFRRDRTRHSPAFRALTKSPYLTKNESHDGA